MAKDASAWLHRHFRASYIWPDFIVRLGRNSHQCDVQAKDANTGTEPLPQSGGIVPPRACTRFGTGVLPIVTQSLMSTMPMPAATSGSDHPISATHLGLPQSPALQPCGTDMHRSSVPSEDAGEQPTPPQSTEAGSQPMGKVQWEVASQPMETSEPSVDSAAIAVDLADAQPADGSTSEQHVWGATLTQSHGRGSEAADDCMRAMSLQSTKKKRGAERAVTPRTLHK